MRRGTQPLSATWEWDVSGRTRRDVISRHDISWLDDLFVLRYVWTHGRRRLVLRRLIDRHRLFAEREPSDTCGKGDTSDDRGDRRCRRLRLGLRGLGRHICANIIRAFVSGRQNRTDQRLRCDLHVPDERREQEEDRRDRDEPHEHLPDLFERFSFHTMMIISNLRGAEPG